MIRLDLLGVSDSILRTFANSRDLSLSDANVHDHTVSIMNATAQCILDGRDRSDAHGSLGNTRMRMKAAQVWETTVLALRASHVAAIDAAQSTQAIMSMLKVRDVLPVFVC
jgi:hypothetical protein